MNRATTFALFAAAFVSLGVPSATGSPPIPLIRDVDMANLSQNERELNVAVDPNNPNLLAAGANQRSGTQEWYVSSDGGRNWSNGALPNGTLTVPATTTTLMSDPSLAFGSNHEIYYSALMHGAMNEPCTLFVSESGDNGANWTDPANGIVAAGNDQSVNPNTVLCNDKEMILVDRQQNDDVYVAWTPIDPTSAPNDRQLAVSVDRNGASDGFSFSAPTYLSNSCFNHGADIAEDSSGNLYVAWTHFCSGTGDGASASVFVSKSTDHGANWSTPVTAASLNNVAPTGINANFRTRSFPSLAVDPATNRVYVVYDSYKTAPTTDANIYIVSSADGQTSWSSPTQVNQDSGTSEQVMPWIAIGSGRLMIDYYSRAADGTNWNLNVAYGSASASPTFTEKTVSSANTPPTTGFLGDYVGMAWGSDDVAHAAWGDGRSGVGGSTDAYGARIDFSPPSNVTIAATTPVEVGNLATVTATVTGAGGEAEQFIPIKFTVTSSGSPSATSSSGNSNASGQRSFSYTNTVSGTDTVKVWADLNEDGVETSDEDVQTTIKWNPGPPASLVLAPKTAVTPVTTQHCLTATVRDKYGNLVAAGWPIVFTVSGGASTSGTVATNSSGQAQFCHTGPTSIFAPTGVKWGADAISAYADNDANGVQNGTEPGDTASNTWVAGPPTSLTLSPTSLAQTVGTQACVSAVAKDVYGNPTEGVTVRFKVTGANSASGSQAADTIGHAAFCYTGTAPGSDTIAAFADTDSSGTQNGGEPGAIASATWCSKKCR